MISNNLVSKSFHFKQFSLLFDQVWPKSILDFKQMCLGLAQIYPNGKMDNISNIDLNDLQQLYIQIVSFQVIKWVIWPSLTKVKALVITNTHFDRNLDGPKWKKSWIQSLLHSSSSTFGLMVKFSFGKVSTTQFWILKEFIATHWFSEP